MQLGDAQYILNANYKAVLKAINIYEQDNTIAYVDNRSKLNWLLREFLRVFHNYLSSVFTLIEHTYVFRKKLDNKQLDMKCEEEVKKLKANECVVFLKDLRTYTQHCGLPLISANFSFKKSDSDNTASFIQKLLLKKESMLEWRNWSPTSRRYIEKQQEDIELKNVASEYQRLITEFYGKFFKHVSSLYVNEINECLKIESEMLKIQEEKEKNSASV